jgi:hypothetical protein
MNRIGPTPTHRLFPRETRELVQRVADKIYRAVGLSGPQDCRSGIRQGGEGKFSFSRSPASSPPAGDPRKHTHGGAAGGGVKSDISHEHCKRDRKPYQSVIVDSMHHRARRNALPNADTRRSGRSLPPDLLENTSAVPFFFVLEVDKKFRASGIEWEIRRAITKTRWPSADDYRRR